MITLLNLSLTKPKNYEIDFLAIPLVIDTSIYKRSILIRLFN